MKKIFLYSCLFVFLFSLAVGLVFSNKNDQVVMGITSEEKNVNLKINGYQIQVELALTPTEHYQGLSGRSNLIWGQGMLFVFDSYATRNFIMRDMKFPLDIVWIRDNKVVGCEANVPILDQNGQFFQVVSPEPVNLVLELNGGSCANYGLKKGTTFDTN